jgi:uncharacterized membrane protein YcaP (DUF421 family)
MEFFQVFILSIVSFGVLFLLSKLMGYRAISELSFFDYVVGITIGSIAAEMSTNIDLEWWKGVTAMTVYAVTELILSIIAQKSKRAREIVSGKPIILIQEGRIIKSSLKKARIEMNDLLTSARIAGYFNLADIDYAIMEHTGAISFLPVPTKRELNPKDFNFAPMHEGLCTNLILDGEFLPDGLKTVDMTEAKVQKILDARELKKENILLLTINSAGQIDVFEK